MGLRVCMVTPFAWSAPHSVNDHVTAAAEELGRRGLDVVHAHDPGLPSLSYVALRKARGLAVATFHSAERLGYPPGKAQREKFVSRVDALTATSDGVLEAAHARFPGDFTRLPLGVDVERFRPGPPRKRFVLEWRPEDAKRAAAAVRALRELDEWELVVLRTRPLAGRPYVPLALAGRVLVERAYDGDERAAALAGATGFVP